MALNQSQDAYSISTLLSERQFDIKKDEKSHTTKHLYYEGWPDIGVPSDLAQLSILVSIIIDEIRTTA